MIQSLELWQLSEMCFDTRCAELFDNNNNSALLKTLKHEFERRNQLHHYDIAIAVAERKFENMKKESK